MISQSTHVTGFAVGEKEKYRPSDSDRCMHVLGPAIPIAACIRDVHPSLAMSIAARPLLKVDGRQGITG